MHFHYKFRYFFTASIVIIGFFIASPLASQDPIKIVPLGNSITSARVTTAGANSYRRNLWHKLVDAGYHVDFVGSQDKDDRGGTYPDASFDHDHEGHWGWRADQVVADLAKWLGGYTPDVALIHLGSNDILQDNTVASTIDEIEVIINILRGDNSEISIFLAQILPLPDADDNANVNLLNSALVDVASSMNQAHSKIVIVNQNSGWNIASDTYDNIHPNTSGEEKMAAKWFNAFTDMFIINEPPEIRGQDALSTNEDTPLELVVSDFEINDPDTDPSDLVLLVEGGDHYAVSGTTITPSSNWNGTLSVPVRVYDGTNTSESFDAVVTVVAVDDPPVISGQRALSTDEKTALELLVSDFVVDDPDSDSSDFALEVEEGDHYTVSGTTITPSINGSRTLSVPVRVFDGSSKSNRFDAIVTVHEVPFSTEWAPLGAEWYYDMTYAFSGDMDYRRVYCDSIISINGIDCRRIHMGSACNIHFHEPVYTYDKNDTIFFFNPDIDSFQVLYNFNAQAGDQWEIFVRDRDDILDTVLLQIDSVGTTVINGVTLIRQFVTYNYSNWPGQAYVEKSEVVQKLGDIKLVINIIDQSFQVCDANFVRSLRCYEDEELGLYNTGLRDSCDYTFVWVNTENSTNDSRVTVYPNPANEILIVDYDGIKNLSYEIVHMNGTLVLSGQKFPIDISEIREGIFLLRLTEDGRMVDSKKFIKAR